MLRQNSTAPVVEEIPETPFYIPATGSSTRPRRTLKHGDCFAVLDSYADIGASVGGPDGMGRTAVTEFPGATPSRIAFSSRTWVEQGSK